MMEVSLLRSLLIKALDLLIKALDVVDRRRGSCGGDDGC